MQKPSVISRYDANVDRELVQLSFTTEAGALLGLINWYAVHPVSMNNTNVLVTSDNIGYASVLSETQFNNGALPGKVSNFATNS